MGTVDLRHLANPADLAGAAAKDWVEAVSHLASTQPVVAAALSGGRIAQTFLTNLAERLKDQPAWLSQVHFFWSDERCVPPNDPESNFHLANDALFKAIHLPAPQIHRIQGEKPPAQACKIAETELRQLLGSQPGSLPVLDLVLLGMGEDGHIASLFPGEPEDASNSPALFRSVTAVKPPPLRITMGYSLITAARHAWVLASGSGKQAALRQSIDAQGRTPLACLLQMRARTRIDTDIAL